MSASECCQVCLGEHLSEQHLRWCGEVRVVVCDGQALGVDVLYVGELDCLLSLPDEVDEPALAGGEANLHFCKWVWLDQVSSMML